MTRLSLVPKVEHRISDAFADFKFAKKASLRSPRTIEYYERMLVPFLEFLEGEGVGEAEAITPTHVRHHLTSLHDKGWADATVHGSGRAIRAFLRFLEREEYRNRPLRFEMPKVEQKAKRVLAPEQLALLLAACQSVRDRALLLLMVDTGARLGEVASLEWGDVNLESGVVHIRRGKGKKARSVMIGNLTRRALLKHRAKTPHDVTDPVWGGSQGRLVASGIRQVLRRAGAKAGVRVGPHDLRRTFAVLALRGGMNVFVLQSLLGHTSLTMVRHYVSLVEDDLQRAHEQSGPVDRFLK